MCFWPICYTSCAFKNVTFKLYLNFWYIWDAYSSHMSIIQDWRLCVFSCQSSVTPQPAAYQCWTGIHQLLVVQGSCGKINLLVWLGLCGSRVLVVWFDETSLSTKGSLCLGILFVSLDLRLCTVSPRAAEAPFLEFTLLGQEQGAEDKPHLPGQTNKQVSDFPKCLVPSLLPV